MMICPPCETNNMIADALTNALQRLKFEELQTDMGLVWLEYFLIWHNWHCMTVPMSFNRSLPSSSSSKTSSIDATIWHGPGNQQSPSLGWQPHPSQWTAYVHRPTSVRGSQEVSSVPETVQSTHLLHQHPIATAFVSITPDQRRGGLQWPQWVQQCFLLLPAQHKSRWWQPRTQHPSFSCALCHA